MAARTGLDTISVPPSARRAAHSAVTAGEDSRATTTRSHAAALRMTGDSARSR